MAISKKNRRTFKHSHGNFLWWIDDEFDEEGSMLSVNIASEDKKFLIKYFWVQTASHEPYLSVIGEYFPGIQRKFGNKIRLRCPNFSGSRNNEPVTPNSIKEILDWCFANDSKAVS